MTLLKQGDLHNFGRQVSKYESNGQTFYRKPRPIHTELFLLGKDSPLRKILLSENSSSRLYQALESLFSLDGEIKRLPEDWCDGCGHIKEIKKISYQQLMGNSKVEGYLEKMSYIYGVILGYSHVLGIRDLNFENLIFSENGYHLIDAEVAFETISFVSQTNGVGTDQGSKIISGMAGFWVALGRLKQTDQELNSMNLTLPSHLLKELITGYLSIVDLISAKRKEMENATSKFLHESKDIPLRLILRNSSDYSTYLQFGISPRIAFIKSELIQLERKEIPYFYYTPDNDQGRYLTGPLEGNEVIDIPEGHPMKTIFKMIKRNSIPALFEETRIKKIRASGAIELFREFGKGQINEYEEIETKIKEEGDKITYQHLHVHFSGPAVESYAVNNFGLNFEITERKLK